MAHTIYENKVLENKIENLLATSIDMNAYMTVDYSLTESAGMKKVINKYTATGDVEDLQMGEGNQAGIEVSFTPAEYTVGTTQGYFAYYDEQEMTDPMVVEAGLQGLAQKMTNDLTTKAIAAMDEATLVVNNFVFDFDHIVDAIALYPYESEEGLFMLINPAHKYSEGFARTGYIGTVCGVPVIVSKAVPAGKAFLATKDAVTCFVKKGSEIEQDRDADVRQNKVWARKVMVVALTDATKIIKLDKAAKAVVGA